jgi:heptosyltransferase-2
VIPPGFTPRSILVVRTSALGDVVLATSVIEPLRARFPGARLEWLTDRRYLPLLETVPGLAAVHPFTSAGEVRRRLRGRFDLAIDLQNKLKTHLVVSAAGDRRVVFRRRATGLALLAMVGWDPPLNGDHATELYARALAPLGISGAGPLRIRPPAEAIAQAEAALAAARPPVVAVAPGARWVTKRWPAARFAAVADDLAAQGASLVLTGGPDDAEAIAAFRSALRSPLAADLTSLSIGALAAALGRVSLLISGDSGPSHLATALGTPVLALFGPTSARRWGPPPPGRAITLGLECSPCSNHGGRSCPLGHHRCLLDLGPERVMGAAREMLTQLRRSSA